VSDNRNFSATIPMLYKNTSATKAHLKEDGIYDIRGQSAW